MKLTLLEKPVFPGGRLVGRVETDLAPHQAPEDGFLVRLGCREERNIEESRSSILLWRDERRTAPLPPDAPDAGLAVPVAFDFPTELPSQWNPTGDGATWRLRVSAELPEGALAETLTVPIETREAPPDPTNDKTYERLKAFELPPRRPSRAGIDIQETARRFAVHLDPVLRRRQALKSTAVALCGTGGVIWALYWMTQGSWAALLIALFAGAFAYGYGRAALHAWLHTVSIVVEDGAVTARFGLARWQAVERVPVQHLDRIDVVPSESGMYDFVFRRDEGETIPVRAALSRKEEANWMAMRLSIAAGIRQSQ